MSKNRNRAKLKKAQNNREYNITLKHYVYDYCYICARRCGSFYADCSPQNMRAKGIHGSGKLVYAYKFRAFKTWKHNRKTKWKLKRE
jgi:hypothetical protein